MVHTNKSETSFMYSFNKYLLNVNSVVSSGDNSEKKEIFFFKVYISEGDAETVNT